MRPRPGRRLEVQQADRRCTTTTGISIDGPVRPGSPTTRPALRGLRLERDRPASTATMPTRWDRASPTPSRAEVGPTLIICRKTIGKCSPTAPARHGARRALAPTRSLTRAALAGAGPSRSPRVVYAAGDGKPVRQVPRGRNGTTRLPPTAPGTPRTGRRICAAHGGELPNWLSPRWPSTAAVAAHAKAETVASRKASQLALEAFTAAPPELLAAAPT